MAELYQLYAEKQTQIENVVQGLLHSGMISMEEAQEIEKLVPGELANIDPNIIFDLDPSTHGSKIALEAALAGLDKIKIAFIIAVVAFILRYISSLNNAAGYKFGGGTGGGWGGAASSAFESNSTPVSASFSRDVAEHQNLLIDDFKINEDKFKEQFDRFKPWASNLGHLRSLKENKALKRLVDVVIKDILSRNMHEDANGNTYFFSEGEKNMAFVQIVEGKGLTDQSLGQLVKVLESITNYYNPKSVFSVNTSENKIQIPKFIINKELTDPAFEFIKQVKTSVTNLQAIESDVSGFLNKLKPNIGSRSAEGSAEIFKWVGDHFIVEKSTGSIKATDLGAYLLAVSSIQVPGLEEFTPQHRITIDNTNYLDTAAISARIKKMIGLLTGGTVNSTGGEVDDGDLDALTRNYFEAITKGKAEDVDKVINIERFIPLLEEFNEQLQSGYKNFESLQDLVQEFITTNANLKDTIDRYNDENDDEEVKERGDPVSKLAVAFRTALDITYNALIAFSSCFAGVATMGAHVHKFEIAKARQVIGKLNEMNKHYFDLAQELTRLNEANPS